MDPFFFLLAHVDVFFFSNVRKEICEKAMADIKAENGLDVFEVLLQALDVGLDRRRLNCDTTPY